MSHGHHDPELPYCRNCHFTLATPRPVYCGHCGQETDLHPPSVREMATEYVGHYVAFDGPLWRTLWALFFLPGHLTLAYFHGRRRRYVLPLRVYLSASFVFFIGWTQLQQGPSQVIEADPPAVAEAGHTVRLRDRPGMTPAQAAAEAEALSRGASGASAASGAADGLKFTTKLGDCDPARTDSCSAGQRWLAGLIEKAKSMTFEQFMTRGRALAPYAMLAMQPVFATLLLILFAGSGRRYAEHFVFSLHSHSFWFLALLLAMLARLEGPMMFAVFGHGLVAMRRVYGLGWWGATWRGLVLSSAYFLVLAFMVLAMLAFIAATA